MDRLKAGLALTMSIAGVLALSLQVAAWASGKVGIVVEGPPVRIDSLVTSVNVLVDSAAMTHRRQDSTNAIQDRRLAAGEQRDEMIIALLCVKMSRNDLRLSRIPCSQYVDRWIPQGGQP